MNLRSLVAGIAAGTIANTVYLIVCAADARVTTAALFGFHWLVVVVIHTIVAMLLAGRRDNRPWSATAFLLPIVTVSAAELEPLFGFAGQCAAVAAAVVAGAVVTLFSKRRMSPFWSAGAGSLAGSLIPIVHSVGWIHGVENAVLIAIAGAIFVVTAGVAMFAGRPAGSPVPSVSFGAAHFLGFGAIGIGALLLTPSLAGTPAPPPATGKSGESPSIVLIVLDTVRADHIELYGYERPTMPRFTEFARQHAVVVERAVANGPSSLPTHASLFTGLYPARHGAHKPFLDESRKIAYGYRLRDSIPTLATILGRAGYWTVGISSNAGPLAPAFGLGQGFDAYSAVSNPRRKFLGFSPWASELASNIWVEKLYMGLSAFSTSAREFLLGVPYRRASEINDEVFAALDAAGTRPLFLFVNYMDAHSPYFPPGEYLDRYPGRSSSLMSSRFGRTLPFSANTELSEAERAHFTALYDGELNYLDTELDRLLKRLERHPKWDEMMVIITSDHGETIGERSSLEHSNSLYEEITHIPLVVKPGRMTPGAPPPGSVIPGLVESVDVFPMVLEHAGLPVPDGIDGRAWGRNRTHAFGWLYPSPPMAPEELRSVQDGRWKLVRSSSGALELFNLDFDPGERLNLSVAEGTVRDALLKALDEGVEVEREGAATPDLSEEMRDELRALGYLN